MTNQERMALLMMVYNAIFTSKAQGTDPAQVVIHHPSLMSWDGKPTGIQACRWFKSGVTQQLTIREHSILPQAYQYSYTRFRKE